MKNTTKKIGIVGAGFGGISAAMVLADCENLEVHIIEQATEIRRRILTAFELADKEDDPHLQEPYLTFLVVGGGPTGVELAGGIAEMAKNTLADDYKMADLKKTKVYLIEAGPRVLPAFSEKLSSRANKELGVF